MREMTCQQNSPIWKTSISLCLQHSIKQVSCVIIITYSIIDSAKRKIRRMLENDLDITFSRKEDIQRRKRANLLGETADDLNVDLLSLMQDPCLDLSGSDSVSLAKNHFVSFRSAQGSEHRQPSVILICTSLCEACS